MGFKFLRADGSEQLVSGYMFVVPQSQANLYAPAEGGEAPPAWVDLRAEMRPVSDAGMTRNSAANAVAGAYEHMMWRHKGVDGYDASRLFIDYNVRRSGGFEGVGGATLVDTLDILARYGGCAESTWPNDAERVNERPSKVAYKEAAGFRVDDVLKVPTSLDAWRQCLAEGYPIVFGLMLFESFEQHRKPGLVPSPTEREASRQGQGGHAMVCVGYSERDRLFIVRNSWGRAWGDAGYCYIPYSYMMDERFNFGDAWTLRQREAPARSARRSGVEGEGSSVLKDIATELGAMTDAQWARMIDAMGELTLPHRLGLIALHAAGADGDISGVELGRASAYLGEVFAHLGVGGLEPMGVLRRCATLLGDGAILEETVDLLGRTLSRRALAGLLNELEAIADADDLHGDEEHFLDALVQAWQVEERGWW